MFKEQETASNSAKSSDETQSTNKKSKYALKLDTKESIIKILSKYREKIDDKDFDEICTNLKNI
jgi:hypothetical protein